ncbi:MAG: Hint domain-containing protein [Paracoccaceae bacterium]
MTKAIDQMPSYHVQAYQAGAIRAVLGANQGDAIGGVEDCALGDIYRLKPEARPKRLALARGTGNLPQEVGEGSQIGQPGDQLFFLANLTLLAADGDRLTIVTVWHEASGTTYALPLSPMTPRKEYSLIEAGDNLGDLRLADIICVSFAAGTMITLPGGRPVAIETLAAGDTILTRDNGPQPIRWIGHASLRAQGSFAPVVISAGTLGNCGDLVVSPHHRIFLYQRGARRLSAGAEVLVQAKHLVDDQRVWRRAGGYVDYYSLVFDRHEIIYAEGIPVESLMVNDDTLGLLPDDMVSGLLRELPGLRQHPHFASEAGRVILERVNPTTLFRAETDVARPAGSSGHADHHDLV